MTRRCIQPHERGRKPCISTEGPLKPYQVKVPASLKKWCIAKGAQYIRALLTSKKDLEDYDDLLS